jgi:hypothetical protein
LSKAKNEIDAMEQEEAVALLRKMRTEWFEVPLCIRQKLAKECEEINSLGGLVC